MQELPTNSTGTVAAFEADLASALEPRQKQMLGERLYPLVERSQPLSGTAGRRGRLSALCVSHN